MKIAFWSNVRGHAGVTSNLACISVLSALSCPSERTIVFENHKNIVNLGNSYYQPHSAGCVRESTHYQAASGLERVLRLVEKGEELSEENLYCLTEDYLGKRLFYLPSEPIKSSDYLEYYLEREAIRTMECLEQFSDMVMVDTSAAPLASSRKILQQADLVVVNLNQNMPLLSHFFRNYSSIQEKAFYLIGNYDADSELTKAEIMKRFHIAGSKIGTIPHDIGFSDAMSKGQLIPFLLKNYSAKESATHQKFIKTVCETVSLLQEQIKIGERNQKK